MKTAFYKIFFILILTLLGISCDDSFLDTKPIALASPETFYTTVESIDLALTTCYSYFKVEKVWDLSIVMTMGSIASDEAEAGAGGKGDVVQFQHIDQLRHTPSEAQVFEQTWGYLFRAIGACNVAIEAIPTIEPENAAATATLDQRLGEAYFLRAFNFFYLTIMYGGVPKVDHVLTPDEFTMARSPLSEILDLIKSDLAIAIDKLPTKAEWGNSNVGRASKGAAMAMLAKTYLYESSYAKNYADDDRFAGCVANWDSVVYWAQQVIDMPDYEMIGMSGEKFTTWRDAEGTSPATSAFQYIFMYPANNSSEGVFEIQARNDGLGWFYSRGEALVTWCAPRKVHNAAGGGNLDHGWGWWCPTNFLMNSFETGDPRMEATILDADDSLLSDVYGWVTPNFNDLIDGTGLDKNSHKYECAPEEVVVGPSNWPMGPINLKMIRIADV
jgi:starch-binding outer membrane protein, SusD/RagB family